MRKKYMVILMGIMLSFVILYGCGMNRAVQQTQQSDDGNTADNSQTTDSTNRSNHSSGNSVSTSNASISLEEAQNIALERVPGATEQNISIELERDDGWYIYEGDIEYNGMEYEFEIDADTGNILKWEEERW